MISFVAPTAVALAMLVAVAAVLGTAGGVRASLQRPTYAAGDRWIYVLQTNLGGFPGLNASQGSVSLGLSGLVEVDIAGPAQAVVGGVEVAGVRAVTHTSGFLNGTFVIPGNGTFHASGTFFSDVSEIWEGQDFLPTVTNSSSSYVISLTVGIPFSVTANVWINATTAWTSLPAFNLSVGDAATASFTTDASVTTAFAILGFSNRTQNLTSLSGAWDRQVLDLENVTVEAGTFSTYRMNESLGSFPGLGLAIPSGAANETAWFSNDVGYYVKRDAYVNGTQIAEMRLKSSTYPAAPPGLSLLDLSLLAAIPIAAIVLVAFMLLRRRRKKSTPAGTAGTAGPVGDLPPIPPRGGP